MCESYSVGMFEEVVSCLEMTDAGFSLHEFTIKKK